MGSATERRPLGVRLRGGVVLSCLLIAGWAAIGGVNRGLHSTFRPPTKIDTDRLWHKPRRIGAAQGAVRIVVHKPNAWHRCRQCGDYESDLRRGCQYHGPNRTIDATFFSLYHMDYTWAGTGLVEGYQSWWIDLNWWTVLIIALAYPVAVLWSGTRRARSGHVIAATRATDA